MNTALDTVSKRVFYRSFPRRVDVLNGDGNIIRSEEFREAGFSGTIIFSDKYTIVILDGMFKGIAKCSPEDDFNPRIGLRLAYTRAMIKKLQFEAENIG